MRKWHISIENEIHLYTNRLAAKGTVREAIEKLRKKQIDLGHRTSWVSPRKTVSDSDLNKKNSKKSHFFLDKRRFTIM